MDNNQSNSNAGSFSTSTGTGSSSTSSGMLTGMFRDRDSAERAYSSLSARGYTNDDVNVMMSDDTRKKYFDKSDADDDGLGSKAMEGAGTGSAIGGTLGAIVGAVAAIGTSLLIPGLGIVVAGPLAGALAGAGAGGLTGGLIGGLVGSGIPEEHARKYEQGIKDGHIVMGVKTRNNEDADYLENEWRSHQAAELHR
jgi:hypothetical protein